MKNLILKATRTVILDYCIFNSCKWLRLWDSYGPYFDKKCFSKNKKTGPISLQYFRSSNYMQKVRKSQWIANEKLESKSDFIWPATKGGIHKVCMKWRGRMSSKKYIVIVFLTSFYWLKKYMGERRQKNGKTSLHILCRWPQDYNNCSSFKAMMTKLSSPNNF